MNFTDKDYARLLAWLDECAEEEYRRFTVKLSPGLKESAVMGVRMPKLRSLAKELVRGDWRGYLALARPDTHEERMIKGLVIGMAKCDIDERLGCVRGFVPWINDWAVCDTFAGALKAAGKARERTFEFLRGYAGSKDEFALRFYIVMLMDHFIVEEYVDYVLAEVARIRHDGYYVRMAAAWAVCECFIKFRDKCITLFEDGALDDFTNNKAIRKINESYRVSDCDKTLLKTFKRK